MRLFKALFLGLALAVYGLAGATSVSAQVTKVNNYDACVAGSIEEANGDPVRSEFFVIEDSAGKKTYIPIEEQCAKRNCPDAPLDVKRQYGVCGEKKVGGTSNTGGTGNTGNTGSTDNTSGSGGTRTSGTGNSSGGTVAQSSSGGLTCSDGLERDASGLCLPKNPFAARGGLAASRSAGQLIGSVINYLLIFAGVIAVLFVIIGGYQYMTAGGSTERADKGKKTITQAIIGLVAIVLSFLIVNLVVGTLTTRNPLGGSGTGSGGSNTGSQCDPADEECVYN